MKLFYNPASPYVRKVLVVADESGVRDLIELQSVGLTPVNPVAELNTENPLGKIPALVRADGSVLYDSRVICEYLDSLGNASLFPTEGEVRWNALRQQALADGICDAAILARYEGVVRPQPKQWDVWIDNQKEKFQRALQALEQEASQLNSTVHIGTLSVAIALGYLDFRYADEAWRDKCPVLSQWYAQFNQRTSLQATLPADLQG